MPNRFANWKQNFVEAAACAMSENVYSATLGWLLSTPELSQESRRHLLTALAGRLGDSISIKRATPEWHDIDLLVELQLDGKEAVVAVENKIKSLEHSYQLSKYDASLESAGLVACAKVFLTPCGTAPQSGNGWTALPYWQLVEGVQAAIHFSNANRYLIDFGDAIGRLAGAIELVTSNLAYARFVFEEAGDQSVNQGFKDYVSQCRLANLLCQAWLNDLGNRAIQRDQTWQVKVGMSSRGRRHLVNVMRQVTRNNVTVSIGLQFSGWKLQAFAEPYPYPEQATTLQRQSVDIALAELQAALNLDAKPRKSRDRYHRGIALPAHHKPYDTTAWIAAIQGFLAQLTTVQ
jgi:hypothetical protein